MEKKTFDTYGYGKVTLEETGDVGRFGDKEFEMTAEDGGSYGYIYADSINSVTDEDVEAQIEENLYY